MKQVVAILSLIAGVAGYAFSPVALASGETTMKHAVIQVSDGDPKKWNLALNNAQNMQQALGKDNIQIEIVAYGPGLGMFKADSKVAPRINAALDHNVQLSACATTMRKMKVTKADLVGGVGVVPGGVIEIMKRQSEGWAYIRP
jgi:intracellular sulfur oxidation DsrE/DsrF family protein